MKLKDLNINEEFNVYEIDEDSLKQEVIGDLILMISNVKDLLIIGFDLGNGHCKVLQRIQY